MKERLMIGRVVIILSVALLLVQSGSSIQRVSATELAPAAEITDLNNLDQLKEVFQRDRGTVRLVTLLSPV